MMLSQLVVKLNLVAMDLELSIQYLGCHKCHLPDWPLYDFTRGDVTCYPIFMAVADFFSS